MTESRRTLPSFTDILIWSLAAFGVVFLLAPTLFALITSFGAGRFPVFPPRGWTLDWFGKIDQSYIGAARTSLTVGLATTAVSVVLGVPAGIAVGRMRGRSAGALSAILRSPLQVPYVVIGIAALQFYVMLGRSGLHLLGTLPGLVIAHAVIATPYTVGAVAAGAANLSPNLEAAAAGLGAGRPRTFFRVTLPALRNSIVAGGIFSFLISFDDVPVTLFLIGSGQRTLPVQMYFNAEFSLTPQLFAVATVVTGVTVVLVAAMGRFLGLRRVASV
jgi:ABC-type spermidine/putrescine transport system permease subunit II